MKFLRFLSIALVLVLALSLLGARSASAAGGKVRVMVQFAPGQRGTVERALKTVGAEFHYVFDELNTFAVTIPQAALNGIQHNPNVVLVEEDVPRYPISIRRSSQPGPTLSAGGQVVPYGVEMVQALDVWDTNRDGVVDDGAPTGANRKICIIDSGFYTGHEDLQGVNVSGYNGNLTWYQDGSGHGTHVAGTIVAMNNALGVVGVTPGTVQIYVVRVFDDTGTWAYASSLIDAAYKCRDAGANIISMSLGGSRSSVTEKNGFATLYNNGILSIAAAGNDGTTSYSYPASYDSVISVAAIDANKVVADFSQKNNQVELAAPGVGVLSTVPYLDVTTLTVAGVTYPAGHIEYSARGTASGILVDGGRCTATNTSWSGKVVLCERGDISFYDKVHNVELSGGVAAAIYNNVPGGFLGTLGTGNSSSIIAISLSQEDGQFLVTNRLGQEATVSSTFTQPASGYEYYDGTSMATPHVSAVAALVWSAKPTATNVQIRQILQQTAQDLGVAGRDNSYGYGLVQAKAAITTLLSMPTNELHVGNLTATKSIKGSKWSATVTVTVLDQNNMTVSGVTVTGTWSGAANGTTSCITGTSGACSMTASNMTGNSVTFTVTNLVKSGYTYNSAANVATSITITK
ncbi:MAG: S8 family serine peptidase [Candidatus Methanomethylicaceae archaeon]